MHWWSKMQRLYFGVLTRDSYFDVTDSGADYLFFNSLPGFICKSSRLGEDGTLICFSSLGNAKYARSLMAGKGFPTSDVIFTGRVMPVWFDPFRVEVDDVVYE